MVILKLGIQTTRHWDEICGEFWTVNFTDGKNLIKIKDFDKVKDADEFVNMLGEFSESLSK